jgi:hypothetical protein
MHDNEGIGADVDVIANGYRSQGTNALKNESLTKLRTARYAPSSNAGTFCVTRPKSHNSFVYCPEKPKSFIFFQWLACFLNLAARSKAVNESLRASDRIRTVRLVHHSLRQLLSVRSLIFASCTVCHCMLDGTSGPPHSSGTMLIFPFLSRFSDGRFLRKLAPSVI